MNNGIISDFIFQGFINTSNHQHMFLKMLLIQCMKNSCEGVNCLLKFVEHLSYQKPPNARFYILKKTVCTILDIA